MYKVLAIGHEDFCAGFALAGIETRPAQGTDITATLNQIRTGGQYGIVIVEASWAETQDNVLDNGVSLPVIVPVPADRHWRDIEQTGGDDRYVQNLVKRAIGYPLDLKL